MTNREMPFSLLELDRSEIYLTMGSGAYQPDPEMKARVEETIARIGTFCRPRYAYKILPVKEHTPRSVSINGTVLNTGNVITRYLKNAEQLILFVATAGEEFEEWMQQETRSGDILREFVANNIGSEIAEATARLMAEDINRLVNRKKLRTGNSYSPGYCGWSVAEQQTLFSFFPPDPCGIHLTGSCLMVPIKSISGIIPLGKNVQKMPYGCAICERKDCYKKKRNANSKTF